MVPKDGPRRDVDLTGDLANLKKSPVVIKEGCEYKIEIQFKVCQQNKSYQQLKCNELSKLLRAL
jgi:hypothetical protein